MRILIVDDDELALCLLHHALTEDGHEVEAATDGKQALEKLRSGRFGIVISDWEMPHIDGLELCRQIRTRLAAGYIYVILLTSRHKTSDIIEGLTAGADDFIAKPFDPHELNVRLRTAQRLLSLQSRNVTIFALAKLADSRDPETGAHLERMREYTRILAEYLSTQEQFQDRIDGDYVQLLYLTSPLHDIGKVGIPDRVLLKPGRLTEEEFDIMKQHAVIGAETLAAAARECPEAKFLQMAHDIARTHHERFDGKGYPAGLAGEAIPLCGRIVALADVYDAVTSDRVYRAAMSHDEARTLILEGSGAHFDPDVVAAFLATEEKFLAIRETFCDTEEASEDFLHASSDFARC